MFSPVFLISETKHLRDSRNQILFYFIAQNQSLPLGYKLCMLHYGTSSNLSLKTHRHVIQTSYKPLESAIYIGNDYAT